VLRRSMLLIIDFGPSPTPLNRSAFLGSCGSPISCQDGPLRPLQMLLKNGMTQLSDEAAGIYRLPPCPKYLGTIISRVKIYNTDIVWDQNKKIELIMKETVNHLHRFKVASATYMKEANLIRDFVRLGRRDREAHQSYYS